MTAFTKNDQGKPRYSLLPKHALRDVLKALEHGATKYGEDNWMKCSDGTRYYDAAMRHLEAWLTEGKTDKDSGLPHLSNAICCLMFLAWMDTKEEMDAATR